MLIADVLFWLFAVLALLPVLPLRWSLFAYVVSTHLNLSGGGTTVGEALAVDNAVRIVLLPTVLLVRARTNDWRAVFHLLPTRLWVALGLYIILAATWSPFPVAAVKQIAYLYCYTSMVLVFVSAYGADPAGISRFAAWSIVASIALGVIQTFLAGSPYGGIENRFSSYSPSQGYALSLALAYGLVVTQADRGLGWLMAAALSTIVVIPVLLLTGSRSALAAVVVLALGAGISWLFTQRSMVTISGAIAVVGLTTTVGAGAFLLAASLSGSFRGQLKSQRSLQLAQAVMGTGSLTDIDTFGWRLGMYLVMSEHIRARSPRQLLLGSGTSSTAEIIASGEYWYRGYTGETVDANRIAHNEYLRALYEWGVFGMALTLALVVAIFAASLRYARRAQTMEGYLFLCVLLVLGVFFGIENLMAGSGTPVGAATTLVIAVLTIHMCGDALKDLQGRRPVESPAERLREDDR